jgi:hypothetical protein
MSRKHSKYVDTSERIVEIPSRGGDPRRDPAAEDAYRTVKTLTDPAYVIAVLVAAVVVMVYLDVATWAIPGLVVAGVAYAIVCTPINRRIVRPRPLITRRQARAWNDLETAVNYLPHQYSDLIDLGSADKGDARTEEDLYVALGETFTSLGLHEPLPYQPRVNERGLEVKQVRLIDYVVALRIADGKGYVLIQPCGGEKETAQKIDPGIIQHALRDVGLTEWMVESRTSYDDDVILFILSDGRSRAFTLGGGEDDE